MSGAPGRAKNEFLIPQDDRPGRMRYLEGKVDMMQRIARSIVGDSSYAHTYVAADFIEQSVAITWIAVDTLAELDTRKFPGFCKTVLQNNWIDIVRRLNRDTSVRTDKSFRLKHTTVDHTLSLRLSAARLDLGSPFSTGDKRRIAKWTPVTTVVLLGTFELWRKLPHRRWMRCLVRSGARLPFPAAKLSNGVDYATNLTVIAETLQRKRDTVRRLLQRNFFRLFELEYVRQLPSQMTG